MNAELLRGLTHRQLCDAVLNEVESVAAPLARACINPWVLPSIVGPKGEEAQTRDVVNALQQLNQNAIYRVRSGVLLGNEIGNYVLALLESVQGDPASLASVGQSICTHSKAPLCPDAVGRPTQHEAATARRVTTHGVAPEE